MDLAGVFEGFRGISRGGVTVDLRHNLGIQSDVRRVTLMWLAKFRKTAFHVQQQSIHVNAGNSIPKSLQSHAAGSVHPECPAQISFFEMK